MTRVKTENIINYLWERPGEIISVQEVVEALGYDLSTVSCAMARYAREKRRRIERVSKGHYTCRGPAPVHMATHKRRHPAPAPPHLVSTEPAQPAPSRPLGMMYEAVGYTAEGTIIVRGEDATIYALAED